MIGYSQYHLARYPESYDAFLTSLGLFEALPETDHPRISATYYCLACVSAVDGHRDRALRELRESLDAGFENPVIFDDPDLASLRGDPQFEAMVSEVRSRQPE